MYFEMPNKYFDNFHNNMLTIIYTIQPTNQIFLFQHVHVFKSLLDKCF